MMLNSAQISHLGECELGDSIIFFPYGVLGLGAQNRQIDPQWSHNREEEYGDDGKGVNFRVCSW